MSFSRLVTACAFGLAGVAFVAFAAPGYAASSSTTKACSQQYQVAKKANTLHGEKWPEFLSKCTAAVKQGAAPAAGQSGAAAPANTDPKTSKSAAVSGTTAGHKTTQQICSEQYQAAKAAGTLGGQKWPDFLSSCSASIKNDKSDQSVVPPDPTTTASTSKSTAPTTGPAGKPLTPGEQAFRQRIHECSTEWQAQKKAGTLPAGAKWPQFWSQCNARLKAKG